MDTPTSIPEASLPASPQHGRAGQSPEPASTWEAALVKGVVNLVTILLIMFLTYHFTIFFATRAPVVTSSTDVEKTLAKKAKDLRAQEKKVISSYGWVNPATKSVRIPVERAMELIAAESAQPVVTAAPAGPSIAATIAPSPLVKAATPPVVLAARPSPQPLLQLRPGRSPSGCDGLAGSRAGTGSCRDGSRPGLFHGLHGVPRS